MGIFDDILQEFDEILNSEQAKEIRNNVNAAARTTMEKASEVHHSSKASQFRSQVQEGAGKAVQSGKDLWDSRTVKKVRAAAADGAEKAADKVIELASRPSTRKYKVAARQAWHSVKTAAGSAQLQQIRQTAQNTVEQAVHKVFKDPSIIEGEFTEHPDEKTQD